MAEKEFRLTPYETHEIPDAIQVLFGNDVFLKGLRSFLPQELSQQLISAASEVRSSFDFQATVVYPFLKWIERESMISLTCNNLDHISKDNKYLFISNHRDIFLDTATKNMHLFVNGIETSQMAIGDNLIKHPLTDVFFRINKSFIVRRTGAPRELYKSSIELSNYIKNLIVQKQSNTWIAQREGRAKDGNDDTQVGLLKMLGLSGKKDLVAHFKQLQIIPVTISYEFDPCDLEKAKELAMKKQGIIYKKEFQDDLRHILLGVTGQKGRVHFEFGQQLDSELDILATGKNKKQQLELLKIVIDRAIQKNYQLRPINYVAFDLMNDSKVYEKEYSVAEFTEYKTLFKEKSAQLESKFQEDGYGFLLQMYATPVVNKRR